MAASFLTAQRSRLARTGGCDLGAQDAMNARVPDSPPHSPPTCLAAAPSRDLVAAAFNRRLRDPGHRSITRSPSTCVAVSGSRLAATRQVRAKRRASHESWPPRAHDNIVNARSP
jgi:hypothetical protein